MKKVMLLFVCIGNMFCSFAQKSPSEKSNTGLTRQEYLQKSKRQKTGAIIMLSAGGALMIVGIASAASNLSYNIDLFGTGSGQQYQDNTKDETLSTVLFFTGLAATLGSIGLFVSAHKNKKRALSMSFKNELAPALQGSLVFHRAVPSLSLKLRL